MCPSKPAPSFLKLEISKDKENNPYIASVSSNYITANDCRMDRLSLSLLKNASTCHGNMEDSPKDNCPSVGLSRKVSTFASFSQPCLPVSNQGPTRILPFLYLGSQYDAMDRDSLKELGINYVINISVSCPKADFIRDECFLRIPVDDSHTDELLPHFERAFRFLDKAQEADSRAIVHCVAGISRSATLAIACVMKYLHMRYEHAYRYVKEKRPWISPNFNFLGQLLSFEKQLGLAAEELSSPPTMLTSNHPPEKYCFASSGSGDCNGNIHAKESFKIQPRSQSDVQETSKSGLMKPSKTKKKKKTGLKLQIPSRIDSQDASGFPVPENRSSGLKIPTDNHTRCSPHATSPASPGSPTYHTPEPMYGFSHPLAGAPPCNHFFGGTYHESPWWSAADPPNKPPFQAVAINTLPQLVAES